MADTVDLGILVPHTFDVIVDDYQQVASAIHHQQIRLSPEAGFGDGSFRTPFSYQFNAPAPGRDAANEFDFKHELQRTTAEMLVAAEVSRRLSHFIYETVAVAADSVTNFSSSNFETQGGLLVPRRRYIESLFDLSNPVPSDIPFLCQMEVSEIALSSPLRLRQTVRNMIVVVNMTVTPAAAPAVVPAAAPVATVTAKIGAAIGAGGLLAGGLTAGITIKIHIDAKRKQELVDRHVEYLLKEVNSGNYRPIQTHLKFLGFYKGKVDNLFEGQSQKATADFAESAKLGRNISHKNPVFLRELVRRMLELNPEFR